MMIQAHKLAKQMVGNYSARLALALRQLWTSIKKGVATMVELTGSEKQIKWATDIRTKLVEKFTKMEKLFQECEDANKGYNDRKGRNAGWYESFVTVKNIMNELKIETFKNSNSKYFIECNTTENAVRSITEQMDYCGNADYVVLKSLEKVKKAIQSAIAGKNI